MVGRRIRQSPKGKAPTYEGRPCKHCRGTIRYESNGQCVPCQIKKQQEFYRRNKDKHNAQCRDWERRNKRSRKNTKLKYRYNLPWMQFFRLFVRQDGNCAICDLPFTPNNTPRVDHDHKCCPGERSCGKCVRGLLCFTCNNGIGSLKDDPAILRAAAAYVENWIGVSGQCR